ncbi:hypothetical protein ACFC00_10760 [Streptomyces adustus]|uniref:hypothetical protein n=1 Tax=Streptomyces adustus TaxID=1609272 RepID=UPI0035E2E948
MLRRPVAWLLAVVLFVEAVGIAAFNWFLGVAADRQNMMVAGLDLGAMSTATKIGGIIFGLYFASCGVAALLVGVRNRPPAGLGRILLISAAVVHGLLGALAWGLLGRSVFAFMVVVLALIVLLLMTYDRQEGPVAAVSGTTGDSGGPADPGAPEGSDAPEDPADPQEPGDGEQPQDSRGPDLRKPDLHKPDEPREAQEAQEAQEAPESRQHQESRESQESQESQEAQELRESEDGTPVTASPAVSGAS